MIHVYQCKSCGRLVQVECTPRAVPIEQPCQCGGRAHRLLQGYFVLDGSTVRAMFDTREEALLWIAEISQVQDTEDCRIAHVLEVPEVLQ